MNIPGWLGDDKDWTPDATEVPVVGPALSQIHLRVGTLFRHLYFQTVLLAAEEDTVRHIDGVTGEASLIEPVAGLPAVDGHIGIGEDGLKHQLYLPAFPCLGQRKRCLVQSFLVGNALWGGFPIESHTILIGAETLQFPARRHTDLRPFPAVAPVGALEIPLHHIVTAVTAQILAVGLIILAPCTDTTQG